ncbi:hypothetical protein T11_17321 [Trichinella zimbabwensis]|uniref:Retrovirus-related Pol polyprotein from transposon n=1 Tax=Trichinella zimbabwensis TaxID=268475 RepID=A0A0V1GD97_9BILA|nr:hypothetical protein T11_17321 [Trichinella zimbabwensis]
MLNKYILRHVFQTSTPFQAVRTIPSGMKYFTVIDNLKGYQHQLLGEESSAFTTFSTPFLLTTCLRRFPRHEERTKSSGRHLDLLKRLR